MGPAGRRFSPMVHVTTVEVLHDFVVRSTGLADRGPYGENIVSANPPPDHVRLPLDLLYSILESSAPVLGPGHLEDALGALDALDAKPFPEGPLRLEILHELGYGKLEALLIFGRKRSVILLEPIGLSVGRQAFGYKRSGVEGVEEVLVRPVGLHAAFGDIERSLALACLPRRRPEPCLGGVDDLLGPQEDPLRDHLDRDGITFFEVSELTDLTGDRHLPLGSNSGIGHKVLLWRASV